MWQDDFYTPAWDAEFERQVINIPILYADPGVPYFDEGHTQWPDTVIVPPSYFHDFHNDQNQESCLTSDQRTVSPPNHQSHDQSRDLETATGLRFSNISKQTYESNTDIEIAYEPLQHPPSRQSDPSSTTENIDLTAQDIPQYEPSNYRGRKNTVHSTANLNYSKK